MLTSSFYKCSGKNHYLTPLPTIGLPSAPDTSLVILPFCWRALAKKWTSSRLAVDIQCHMHWMIWGKKCTGSKYYTDFATSVTVPQIVGWDKSRKLTGICLKECKVKSKRKFPKGGRKELEEPTWISQNMYRI